MEHNYIAYRKRKYKYQLLSPLTVQTGIIGYNINEIYFHLTIDGLLTIHSLYSWDGASGPTIDDNDDGYSKTIVPSLLHDCKYQMLRLGLLPQYFKTLIDQEFHDDLVERGFNHMRADIWHLGVHYGGGYSCKPGSDTEDIFKAW